MSETSIWSTTAPLPLGVVPAPVASEPEVHDALRPGTRLDEFEIVSVLGAGGFGIVYLALDHVLLRHVAIKEYMPTALAGRAKGAMVSVRSSALADTFAMGLESFFSEARMLASFDHASLVKVHRFWKANGTAYMVMPYYAGQTLKEARRTMVGSPDEAWLRALVEPLLGALELLHGEGVYHRDIAPDNILLLPDGRPVLLDFGSARRVIGDRTQTLTAVLKPNFAPVEQYADEAGMRQGPWTDLYALGATVHFVLTGQPPTPAVMRAVRDALPALSTPESAAYPGVPATFLATIDWAMALAPNDRPQSVARVRQAFSGEIVPPPPSPRHVAVPRLPAPPLRDTAVPIDGAVDAIAAAAKPEAARPATPRAGFAAASLPGRAGRAVLASAALCAASWAAWAWTARSVSPAEAAVVAPIAASDARAPTRVAETPPAAPASRAAAVPRLRAAAAESRPPAATLAVAEPGSPKDACSDRNFFARAVCVDRQCALPRWQAHPTCVEIRRFAEQRQQRNEH